MDQLVQEIIDDTEAWIRACRERFWPMAAPLPGREKDALANYFPSELLDKVGIGTAEIENPPFYERLRGLGFKDLIDFRNMAGITFIDTVILSGVGESRSGRDRLALLAHELAHVEQYRRLGVQRFARIYVTSWFQSRRYEQIILEMHAYSVESQFRASPVPFSVARHLDALMVGLS